MRADRLLSILLLLESRGRVTSRQLAERLHVSQRTILRDMEALSGSSIPVVAARGQHGGWSLLDTYHAKLTGLSLAEVQSLFLARPARLMSDLGLKQESDLALTKLQASLPAAAREQAELARGRILIDARGWRDPAESVSCLPLLLEAVWKGRQIRCVYARDLAEPCERTAHPLGLVAKGSTWYLVASVDEQTRTYRVSRVREVAVLDLAVVRPPRFELADHWERSASAFREQLPRYYATFLAESAVMRWIRYRGWRVEEESPAGERIRVKMRFDIEEEAVQFALSFGGQVAVIEPPELQAKVLAGATAILNG